MPDLSIGVAATVIQALSVLLAHLIRFHFVPLSIVVFTTRM
jgi:hypothetical protein